MRERVRRHLRGQRGERGVARLREGQHALDGAEREVVRVVDLSAVDDDAAGTVHGTAGIDEISLEGGRRRDDLERGTRRILPRERRQTLRVRRTVLRDGEDLPRRRLHREKDRRLRDRRDRRLRGLLHCAVQGEHAPSGQATGAVSVSVSSAPPVVSTVLTRHPGVPCSSGCATSSTCASSRAREIARRRQVPHVGREDETRDRLQPRAQRLEVLLPQVDHGVLDAARVSRGTAALRRALPSRRPRLARRCRRATCWSAPAPRLPRPAAPATMPSAVMPGSTATRTDASADAVAARSGTRSVTRTTE